MSKLGSSFIALCCGLLLACSSEVPEVPEVAAARAALGQDLRPETEPNEMSAQATAISNNVVVRAPVFAGGDVDFYSFSGQMGDRVYAAVMTAWSASGSVDSRLQILGSDGTTVLELDDDDGFLGATSSSIAGLELAAAGTYFVRVSHPVGTGQLRPYDLHFRVQPDAPTAETEPNEMDAQATALPASGFASGDLSATTDVDVYSIQLNAGDSVYAALDLDPERDTTEWNGQLSIGRFGGQLLTVNDAGASTPDSEALFETAKTTGTYYIHVSVPPGGTTFGTYHLSVSVHPGVDATGNCTTYTSTNVPVAIPSGPAAVTSTITVPGNPRIADIDVSMTIDHNFPQDLDAQLVTPGNSTVGLFSDVGFAVAAAAVIDITLDDEAARPIGSFAMLNSVHVQPELAYRLHWLDGIDAGGTWTLDIRDDATGDAGNLTAWSIRVCEPAAPPVCTGAASTILNADFEAGDNGFTHAGAGDEWERGLPTFGAITTCNGGTSCWKTDLDNTYNASANNDLISAPIDLSAVDPDGTVRLSWAMKYQIESATFDHAWVDIRNVDDTNPRRLFRFLDATMTNTIGNPGVTFQEAAGWGVHTADVSDYAGNQVELVFHFASDTTVQLAGLAVDDVTVTACQPVCGNDILEAGEACDDGVLNGTPTSCCSATCTFEPTTKECRAAANVCDVAEMCDGAGACPSNGFAVDGFACNDSDSCTQTDTCQTGVCTGSNPVVCAALDSCHVAGTCDPATGTCSNPNQTDGTACSDSDMCTQTDTCQTGVCTGANPAVCAPLDSCHVAGTCDPTTGACSNPNQTDGTACSDSDMCTQTDTCQSGACTGASPVVCTASDECHAAGTCNPATGDCSDPERPDGTDCGDDGMCESGECEEPDAPTPDPDADGGVDEEEAGSGGRGGRGGSGAAGRGGAGRGGFPSRDGGSDDGGVDGGGDGDDGCGCSVPGSSRPAAPALTLTALALAGLLQRRRRRR